MRLALPKSIRGLLAAALAAIGLAGACGSARAEFPERPITIVVGFPAGGGSDAIARLIGVPLGEALGKPVIIENRPGAGGNIGIGAVARAQPDGYTLLFSSSVIVINPSLYRSVPFDTMRDFTPLVNVGVSPAIYTVRADSRFKSLKDLIDAAKAAPGTINYTDAGIGTTAYLHGRMLRQRAGIDMQLVPYAGSGPAAQALVAGTIDMFITSVPSVAGLLASGQIRMLAHTGPGRLDGYPDVPNFAEAGFPNAESETFQGLFLPAGTPAPIAEKLADELTKAIRRPDIAALLRTSGLEVLAEGPAAFRARVVREIPYYKDIIDKAGIKLN